MTDQSDAVSPQGWREAILNRRILICVFTGLVSGMPLYLLYQLLIRFRYGQSTSLSNALSDATMGEKFPAVFEVPLTPETKPCLYCKASR